MSEEIREAIERAQELVRETREASAAATREAERSDQTFQTAYDAIQRDLGVLRRAWR